MASIADVRVALAETLETVDGLRVHAFPAMTYTRPCALVGWPEAFDTTQSFTRTVTYRIPVKVEVDAPHDRGADVELGRFIEADGATSIEQAVDDDPTLGAVVHSAAVVEWRDLGPASDGDNWIMTATAVVEVLA
jgi:hypothetical protein